MTSATCGVLDSYTLEKCLVETVLVFSGDNATCAPTDTCKHARGCVSHTFTPYQGRLCIFNFHRGFGKPLEQLTQFHRLRKTYTRGIDFKNINTIPFY